MYKNTLTTGRRIDLSRYDTVNATKPAETVSDKYRFIPTTRVIDVLADHGWQPVRVTEARTRIPEKQGYQKHAITLANERLNDALKVGGTTPRLVVTNSHSGSAAFRFHVGLHELVCANGLLVNVGGERYRITHRGYADVSVGKVLHYITQELIQALNQAERYRSITLDERDRQQFARDAIELRWNGDSYSVENPEQITRARRRAQAEPSLWHVFNVAQEALLRGGVWQRNKAGSLTRSRAVKSIDQVIRINKGLWSLMEQMAERKGLPAPVRAERGTA